MKVISLQKQIDYAFEIQTIVEREDREEKKNYNTNKPHIPVELRLLLIGIVRCSDCQSIHDGVTVLF